MANVDATVEGMDFLRGLARAAVPEVYAALEDVLRVERNRLIKDTPRGDGRPIGHMADKWRYEILVHSGGLNGRLFNIQPYAGYARGPWPSRSLHAARLLLSRRQQRRISDRILEESGTAILKAARRG